MYRILEPQVTEYFDCQVSLSTNRVEATQLRDFVDAQMPKSGVGEVPWSTPLSSDQLVDLAEKGKVEFVAARMMLAAEATPPMVGFGALVQDSDTYPYPRIIIVVDTHFRGLGLGKRIARELLKQLNAGATVQAEVQHEISGRPKAAAFFEYLGFECVEENHRTGLVPEYANGEYTGTAERQFALYSFVKRGH